MFDAILVLFILCIVITLICMQDQPMLPALVGALITSSAVMLVLLVLIGIHDDFNDEVLAADVFFETLLLIGLALRRLTDGRRSHEKDGA